MPYKGFKYLITALADRALADRELDGHRALDGHQAKLLLIGTGPEKSSLKKLAKKLGVTDKIFFLDPVPDLKPYYLAADLFVFPSCEPNEAFGLVQLEAMAYGKPVINTYLKTAVEEVSLNGLTGLTVPPKDPAALARD